MMLRDDAGRLVVSAGYFGTAEPEVFASSGTYYESEPDFAAEEGTECGWVHSLGDVVTALGAAGLRVEFLHEHPFTHFRMLPSFVRSADGTWTTPPDCPRVPLTFSLRATR